LSAFFIYFGAVYTVESVINLAELLNIERAIIAVSVVALGTSAPELLVSLNASRKGKSEIDVGNVLGSNIFNVFGVMGIAGLFGTLVISPEILTFALPMMIIATLLYFFTTQDKEITRWEGGLLLIFYVFFIGALFSIF
jgi:cation:H+ antiporter